MAFDFVLSNVPWNILRTVTRAERAAIGTQVKKRGIAEHWGPAPFPLLEPINSTKHGELCPEINWAGSVWVSWRGLFYLKCQLLMPGTYWCVSSFGGGKKHLNCKIPLREIMSGYHILLCTALPDNKAMAVNIPFSLDFHLHVMQMAVSRFPLW